MVCDTPGATRYPECPRDDAMSRAERITEDERVATSAALPTGCVGTRQEPGNRLRAVAQAGPGSPLGSVEM